ncbi:hypothetical protein FGG08_001074 [Glutinoglossum americanum]|uniref:P-loop containing nucleoside triphosphate hydrolase protein n=1 Tax=Glutinoglossum americanum TaxID=1670608 RepID=A0A9P8L5L7_9PEZI|nr:hypothetical protein FGG08_001074 [Glutinoglossum americanum]
MTTTPPPPHKAIIIGISGCSSSGKTTLSRLLRSIFPNTHILHQDDFFLPDSQIPIRNGYQDWDCAESLDLVALRDALVYITENGEMPPSLVSMEDQNEAGPSGVPDPTIARLHSHVHSRLPTPTPPIFLLDGFLLYPPHLNPPLLPHLHTKIFLLTTLTTLLARRANRTGYVTLEGFWEDPEGYVERVVWVNYVRDHGFLVGEGGEVRREVAEGLGVRVQKEGGWRMEEVLEWAVGEILEGLGAGKEGEVEGS